MKKLLVLALVLAVAGIANASLTLAYDEVQGKLTIGSLEPKLGGINPIIGVIGTTWVAQDDVLPAGIVLRSGNGAPVANPEWQAILSGPTSIAGELPYDGGTVVLFWGDASLTPNPAGDWMTIDFAGFKLGDETNFLVQVDVVDQVDGAVSSVFLTPEPMTMVLLGLGGLFLRRK